MKLILFFNGWGMDEKIHPKIQDTNEYELISLKYPYICPRIDFEKYEDIYVIGWSFGVYYANLYLNSLEHLENITAIAINGTPELIGENGIKKNMIQYTYDNLTLESLDKFYENMELPELLMKREINFQEIKEELKYFIDNYKISENRFHKAIIFKNDRIIPFKNQKRYFEINNVEIEEISGGHYPFNELKTFEKIVNRCSYEI